MNPFPPSLANSLADGRPIFGTFLSLGSPATAEIAAQAGADWLFVDFEHGRGIEDPRALLLVSERYEVPMVIRPETADRIRTGRLLDAGAQAIVFPRIDGVDEARTAVSGLFYPPLGTRGVASYNPSRRYGSPLDTPAEANARVTGVVQIETSGSLKEVESIAGLDGVDVLFVGPGDLSTALGVAGQLTNPHYLDALDAVVRAATSHGKAAGILAADATEAADLAARGFRLIAIASDAVLLNRSFRQMFETARSAHTNEGQ